MKEIEIVTLDPSDWEVYKNLRLRALKEEPQAFGSVYTQNLKNSDESWRKRLEDAALEKVQWMVFAKREGKVVGMASAFMEEEIDTAHVGAMYVVPEERGKGISKLLMKELLGKIKRNSYIKKIIVEVNAQQEAAFTLYKNSGFAVTYQYRRMLGDGKEHEVVHLEISLEEKIKKNN